MEQLTEIITVLKGYDRDRCLMKSTQHLYDLAYVRIEKELQPLVGGSKDFVQIVRDRVCQLKQGEQTKIITFTLYSRMLSLLETEKVQELYARRAPRKILIKQEHFMSTVARYQRFLATEGKSPFTIGCYSNVARQFLNHLSDNGHGDVKGIPAYLVVSFFGLVPDCDETGQGEGAPALLDTAACAHVLLRGLHTLDDLVLAGFPIGPLGHRYDAE